MAKKESKPTSKTKRIAEEQAIHQLNFQMQAEAAIKEFYETITCLFGVPKVGKTKFAFELGKALQRKYNLPCSGAYFLKCDWINYDWKVRGDYIPTWPTFRSFVDQAEQRPEFVETVRMWVIDTIDTLIPKGISTICHDKDIEELKEAAVSVGKGNWSQEGWQELRAELRYQILRLAALGPGVLILSHERYEDYKYQGIEYQRARMDMSNSIYNAIANDASMILHMRLMSGQPSGGQRCLVSLESEQERAGDNLNRIAPVYPNGVIPFKTEEEAVEKLLGCFEEKKTTTNAVEILHARYGEPVKKVIKKKKKVKKTVRRED